MITMLSFKLPLNHVEVLLTRECPVLSSTWLLSPFVGDVLVGKRLRLGNEETAAHCGAK